MPTRNGYTQVEIITEPLPNGGETYWVVEHNGDARFGQRHGDYISHEKATEAALGLWKAVDRRPKDQPINN